MAGRGKRRFAVHLPLQQFFFAGTNWDKRRAARGAEDAAATRI
jgi:hypothetical protein